jgi:hypothetical protein
VLDVGDSAAAASDNHEVDQVLAEDLRMLLDEFAGQDLGDGERQPVGGGLAGFGGDALLVGVGPAAVEQVCGLGEDKLVVRLDDRDRRLVRGAQRLLEQSDDVVEEDVGLKSARGGADPSAG